MFATLCRSHKDDSDSVVQNAYGQAFAVPAACQPCHGEICKSFAGTAHFRDSRPASGSAIRGSFAADSNRFIYNPSTAVRMERKGDSFYQTAYHSGKEYLSKPFDIVIGSGRKGQSYLYWDNKKLYQLPVSYFTPADCWCKSPGYTADSPVYNRRVPVYCVECHATNARTVVGKSREYGDFFDKRQLIYGIDCERCHGPGAAHIQFHTEHPGERAGVYILNAGRMSRQQKLDACALCHSGSRFPLKPAFSFRVGDTLNAFSEAKYTEANVATLDVHGNQYGLLTTSKCFNQSQMDCSSCHQVHTNEAGDLKGYSQRCMSCHNGSLHKACTMPPTPGLVLGNNCIDCHMPALPSQKIVLQLSNAADTGRDISNLVRTHHIAIYTAYVKAFLKNLKGGR